jgi:hypothetical protein
VHFVRRLHELAPAHETLHEPCSGHWISSPHAPVPEHSTSQELDVLQRILCVHELSPQSTRHGRFAGHCTSVLVHLPAALQSMTQTPASSHVPREQPWAHSCCAVVSASGGRLSPAGAASITTGLPPLSQMMFGATHQPSLQVWPPVHSVAAEHCTVQSSVAGW